MPKVHFAGLGFAMNNNDGLTNTEIEPTLNIDSNIESCLSGGTLITIKGNNFGKGIINPMTDVLIGSEICTLVSVK